MSGVDFDAEGLLDGVEGEARAARLDLLERLAEPAACQASVRRR